MCVGVSGTVGSVAVVMVCVVCPCGRKCGVEVCGEAVNAVSVGVCDRRSDGTCAGCDTCACSCILIVPSPAAVSACGCACCCVLVSSYRVVFQTLDVVIFGFKFIIVEDVDCRDVT